MSSVGKLSGSLEEFRLVELLQVMGLGGSSGALHIHRDDGRTGLVYFDTGMLVSSVELDTEALTLGHVLQQLDITTAGQLEHAFRLQTHDPLGKRIGERLIDLGMLNQDQLDQALKTQTLWTTRELALWRAGSYEFHPGENLPTDGSSPRIDPTNAIMEVLRYEHEWESLDPYLHEGMRTRISMAPEPPLGHPLTFHPAAWRIISQVNTRQTVRRIATALHTPELDIARMMGPLIQEGLLTPVGSAGEPGLPEDAARLSMQHFDLFTLLISMEQDWLKRKSLTDQLVALASYINQTMRALEDACVASGLRLSPDTLASLLERENLVGVEGYRFVIERNHIDVEGFSAFCRSAFSAMSGQKDFGQKQFYERTFEALLRALAAAFQAINARVASPIERVQNQEAWEEIGRAHV